MRHDSCRSTMLRDILKTSPPCSASLALLLRGIAPIFHTHKKNWVAGAPAPKNENRGAKSADFADFADFAPRDRTRRPVAPTADAHRLSWLAAGDAPSVLSTRLQSACSPSYQRLLESRVTHTHTHTHTPTQTPTHTNLHYCGWTAFTNFMY